MNSWNSLSPRRRYLFFCLALLPLVLFFSFSKPWELGADFWDTAAAVRELAIHPLHPDHHLYLLPGSASPRFNPYTLFWGLFKRITGLGIFATMGIAGIANYIIFILGLFLFTREKYKIPSLPAYVFLTMLWVWGTGYAQANAYHLLMFLVCLPYIGFFAFSLSLAALFFLNRYSMTSNRRDLLFYCFISVTAFVTHPVTGLFCFVAVFSLLLDQKSWKKLLFLQAVPLLALGSSLLWPYFSYGDLFTKNAIPPSFASPLFSNQLRALGPALIGIPLAAWIASRKKDRFPLYGLLFCSLVYGISALAGIAIGGRFVLFAVFFLHLAIALYLEDVKIFSLKKIKKSFRSAGWEILLVLMLFVLPGIYRVREMAGFLFFDKPFRIHGFHSPVKPYLFLGKHVSSVDVVLASDWREAFPLPAMTGARIVEPRHPFTLLMEEEASRRKMDVDSFFLSPLSLEDRISLIKKYKVTHLLLNLKDEAAWHPSFREHLDSMAEEIAREGTIILFKVRLPF